MFSQKLCPLAPCSCDVPGAPAEIQLDVRKGGKSSGGLARLERLLLPQPEGGGRKRGGTLQGSTRGIKMLGIGAEGMHAERGGSTVGKGNGECFTGDRTWREETGRRKEVRESAGPQI